jgi:hypothetical protein
VLLFATRYGRRGPPTPARSPPEEPASRIAKRLTPSLPLLQFSRQGPAANHRIELPSSPLRRLRGFANSSSSLPHPSGAVDGGGGGAERRAFQGPGAAARLRGAAALRPAPRARPRRLRLRGLRGGRPRRRRAHALPRAQRRRARRRARGSRLRAAGVRPGD